VAIAPYDAQSAVRCDICLDEGRVVVVKASAEVGSIRPPVGDAAVKLALIRVESQPVRVKGRGLRRAGGPPDDNRAAVLSGRLDDGRFGSLSGVHAERDVGGLTAA